MHTNYDFFCKNKRNAKYNLVILMGWSHKRGLSDEKMPTSEGIGSQSQKLVVISRWSFMY